MSFHVFVLYKVFLNMSELLFQNQLAQALELLNSNTNVCYSSDFPVCPAAFTDDNSIGTRFVVHLGPLHHLLVSFEGQSLHVP